MSFAHSQDDLNPSILHMFKATFSIDAAHMSEGQYLFGEIHIQSYADAQDHEKMYPKTLFCLMLHVFLFVSNPHSNR